MVVWVPNKENIKAWWGWFTGWFNTSPCHNTLSQPSMCLLPRSMCTLHVTLCTILKPYLQHKITRRFQIYLEKLSQVKLKVNSLLKSAKSFQLQQLKFKYLVVYTIHDGQALIHPDIKVGWSKGSSGTSWMPQLMHRKVLNVYWKLYRTTNKLAYQWDFVRNNWKKNAGVDSLE